MRLKAGVSIQGIHRKICEALGYFNGVYADHNLDGSFVVTSGTEDPPDSEDVREAHHSASSLHPCGRAVDLRTWGFTKQDLHDIAQTAQDVLGEDYDIIVEIDHLHIEYEGK